MILSNLVGVTSTAGLNIFTKRSTETNDILNQNVGNNGVYTNSVGFVHPLVYFKSHRLSSDNKRRISSKLKFVNNFKDEIKTSQYKDFRTVNMQLLATNPSETTLYRDFNNNYVSTKEKVEEGPSKLYENIFKPGATVLANMNNYRFTYIRQLKIFSNLEKKGDKTSKRFAEGAVTPSLFSPLHMVHTRSITPHVPLLNGESGDHINTNLSDCSIRTLVRESYSNPSILGLAKYRYSDFMYCKDLGKISNNHLLTLRRYIYPVTDNIFEKYDDGAADIGRLVTWFGTEDNQLENILKYDYEATWKELTAEIENVESREDSGARGRLGTLLNTINPTYNKSVREGHSGSQSIWGFAFGNDDSDAILRNYDKNKVYTPKNTIQDTHTYEGKLKFNHEFTIVFSYKLRAYDNINPKSAMLDLIGNILNVTYRRGKFWGGDRKFIGAPQNTAGWERANAMIDGAWNKAGGALSTLANGGLHLKDIFGMMSGLGGHLKNLVKTAQAALPSSLEELMKQTGIADGALGTLKNMLGRPALYAMNSLLSGDNVGLWHLTIGNPKNPIAAMGNLILTKAEIQHLGPLGLDDFPSEIKVTVSLKHARSRDAIEIERMYTKGASAIYLVSHNKNIHDHFITGGATPDVYTDVLMKDDKLSEEQKNTDGSTKKETKTTAQTNNTKGANNQNNDRSELRQKELKAFDNFYIQNSSININSPYAAQIDQSNQNLSFDIPLLLDELA